MAPQFDMKQAILNLSFFLILFDTAEDAVAASFYFILSFEVF